MKLSYIDEYLQITLPKLQHPRHSDNSGSANILTPMQQQPMKNFSSHPLLVLSCKCLDDRIYISIFGMWVFSWTNNLITSSSNFSHALHWQELLHSPTPIPTFEKLRNKNKSCFLTSSIFVLVVSLVLSQGKTTNLISTPNYC